MSDILAPSAENEEMFFLAIARGRIFANAAPMLKALNCAPVTGFETSRQLLVETHNPNARLLILRGIDVLTYVEHGIAGLGVVGKDMIMEYGGSEVYELLDLGIARCRLVVAGFGGKGERAKSGRRLRIATKYPSATLNYFANMGEQVEIIKLSGSTEMAPRLRLSDLIVDLVETGETLAANNLEIHDEVAQISARLVVNKALMRTRFNYINNIVERLERTLALQNSEEKLQDAQN